MPLVLYNGGDTSGHSLSFIMNAGTGIYDQSLNASDAVNFAGMTVNGNIATNGVVTVTGGTLTISKDSDFTATSGTLRFLQSGAAGKFAPTSGTATWIGTDINGTVNTSGAYAGTTTALRVSQRNQATTGVTANFLIDAGTNSADGGAGTHTSVFRVDTAGATTIGNGGTPMLKVLSTTATLDFGSTLAQTSADLTVPLSGAVVGNVVSLGPPATVAANTCFTAWVSAPDTVTVRHNNYSALAVDPASATFRVAVIKF